MHSALCCCLSLCTLHAAPSTLLWRAAHPAQSAASLQLTSYQQHRVPTCQQLLLDTGIQPLQSLLVLKLGRCSSSSSRRSQRSRSYPRACAQATIRRRYPHPQGCRRSSCRWASTPTACRPACRSWRGPLTRAPCSRSHTPTSSAPSTACAPLLLTCTQLCVSVSVQAVGWPFDEGILLEVAYAYEQRNKHCVCAPST